jgi:hypothetical protein
MPRGIPTSTAQRRPCAGTVLLAVAALTALAALVAPECCFAWGENAERLITSKAIETVPGEMQGFFAAKRQFLVQHVADPLEAEGRNPAEARNSFIQLDHYGQFPFAAFPQTYAAALGKYGRKTLETYGLLPWEIGIYSQKLTMSLRDRNWEEAQLDAALLAHYVASAHDPFNTTINFDGKLSDQPGVNQRFGAGLIDRYQLFFFVKPNEATMIRDPTNYAFEMTLSAHAWLDNVLLQDRRAHDGLTGYSDDFYDRFYAQAGAILIRQLSDAATDVGSYWMTAWINAGRPALPGN